MKPYINNWIKTKILLINLLIVSASKQSFEPLIVNGETTDIQSHPYQVSIRRYGNHCCGGAIITPLYIITAAHCLYPCIKFEIKSTYTVMVGSSNVWTGKSIKVQNCACHKQYSTKTSNFDIAILKLANMLKFTSKIRAINLPQPNYKITTGSSAFISGWGLKKEDGDMSDILQKATVRLYSSTLCTKAYAKYRNITNNMICANLETNENKVVDACQGDSGGPLVQNNCLIGIVSWGMGCAKRGFPGVYTNICKFNSWILQMTKNLI